MTQRQPIALFYARKDVGGGSTSFTIHLYRAFQLAGIPVTLYRFAAKPRKAKMLASYEGVMCEFVTFEQALEIVRSTPSLLTAPEHSKDMYEPDILPRLMAEGLRVVLHDPNEFLRVQDGKKRPAVYDHLEDVSKVIRPFCIRPTMHQFFPSATFIPHPYVREFKGWQGADLLERKAAASIARLTFVKRPTILLDANRLLVEDDRIKFHGAENRLFTKFRVLDKYPEFKQGGYNLPMEWGISARMIREYAFMPDMTYFPSDGGGSQYTFMEAWDAGSVVVINRDWLRYPGEMADGLNCIAVSTPEELAALIAARGLSGDLLEEISRASTEHLDTVHNPLAVAEAYYEALVGDLSLL